MNETARSYKMLSQEADTIDGFTFVWFTDGIGWKSARGNLRETFEVMDTISVQFMDDIFFGFLITEPLIVVVDGDALSQGFVDLAAEYPVQVRFPAKDQGETVDGIITVVHQHLDVL